MEENKVEFGLNNVHFAKITETGGVLSYEAPSKINGAVSLTLDPTGDKTTFYADNIAYYTESSSTGYEGELDVAKIPEKFLIDIMGMKKDTNGALYEAVTDKDAEFALIFEIQGDKNNKRTILYRCKIQKGGSEHSTKEESVNIVPDKMRLIVSPRQADGVVKLVMPKTTTNTEAYNNFFSEVYEPNVE